MRSIHRLRILSVPLCLLVLVSVASVGCGGGDEPNTTTPTIVDLSATTILTVSPVSSLDFPQVQVPDVVGMGAGDGATQLHSIGLAVEWESFPVLWSVSGLPIVEQDPQAGTWVPIVSTVKLTFEEQGVYLPDVIGMSEADAGQALNFGPLTQEHVYAVTPLSDWWGIVMAQSPAPGVLWAHDPPVTIVVGVMEPESATTLSTPRPSPSPITTTTTSLFQPPIGLPPFTPPPGPS